ncbi:MAG: hypothetical protein OEY56_06330 [Cyclobacteriaceae bacterium]|nr:hypothetical protein [Cyclobacteriaceae bacterium]
MKNLFFVFIVFVAIQAVAQDVPIVRITGDEVSREYKILYSSPKEYSVQISLINEANNVILDEKVDGKAFIKTYSLKSMAEGTYQWRLKYGRITYLEEFDLFSEKQLLKQSISVVVTDFSMEINVKPYNKQPMNIFFYDKKGNQLDYQFWEPGEGNYTRLFDLTQFDTYEFKLEIVQAGTAIFSQAYQLY